MESLGLSKAKEAALRRMSIGIPQASRRLSMRDKNNKIDYLGADVDLDNASPAYMIALKAVVQEKNKHLNLMDEDFLYHLGLTKADAPMFKGVEFVLMGGLDKRMTKMAHHLGKRLGFSEDQVVSIGIHKRYVLYLVGPALICSHGMGGPSTSILLHEVAKLLKYAGAKATWLRMGTCGGIGVDEGTIVVTNQAYNTDMKPYFEQIILGEKVQRESKYDASLCQKLAEACKKMDAKYEVGGTLCAYDFYEGQGRTDGVICEFTEAEKKEFLIDIHNEGIRGMEMDGLQIGAFCTYIGVPSGMICSAIVPRFKRDQVTSTPEELDAYDDKLIECVAEFVVTNMVLEDEGEAKDAEDVGTFSSDENDSD